MTFVIFEWTGSANRNTSKVQPFGDDMCRSRITSAQFDTKLADHSHIVGRQGVGARLCLAAGYQRP
jgi:hypothetical protein